MPFVLVASSVSVKYSAISTGAQKSVAPKNQWYITRNHRRNISSSGVA